ncbi:hypothetical protein WKT22_00507 [Candidatus Lokiarchaeum ossiferum]
MIQDFLPEILEQFLSKQNPEIIEISQKISNIMSIDLDFYHPLLEIIQKKPYNQIPYYQELSRYLKQIKLLQNHQKKISDIIPYYNDIHKKIEDITNNYQNKINSINFDTISLTNYWIQCTVPLIIEIYEIFKPIIFYFKPIIQISEKISLSSEIQSNPELLLPIYDFIKENLNRKNAIYFSSPQYSDFDKLLLKSSTANESNHKKILRFYKKFIDNRSSVGLSYESSFLQSSRFTFQYLFKEIVQELNLPRIPIKKIIQKRQELKEFFECIISKVQGTTISEDEYKEDISHKFTNILDSFERNRVFYKFLDYLTQNICNPEQKIKITPIDMKIPVWKYYQEIETNTFLKTHFLALYLEQLKFYKKIHILRNFRGHSSIMIRQIYYSERNVVYFYKNQRKIMSYDKLTELNKSAVLFLKTYEKLMRTHFDFYLISSHKISPNILILE